MEELELEVEEIFERVEKYNRLKRYKVYPKNNEDMMNLNEVEQVYDYLVKKKGCRDEDILINCVFINGSIHMKGFNEIGFDVDRTQEYFLNRVYDLEKFTDDIQSLDIYIYIYHGSKIKEKKNKTKMI